MNKQKKEFQTPYEEYRVKAGYTRESASEELNGISPDKIYRIEKGKQTAEPDIVLQLADLYHAPELCNYHCTHKCEIGQKYIPQVDVQDLPNDASIFIGQVKHLEFDLIRNQSH
ncbi:helix-turn-helix domain-containing protein [Holdemanella biformis]|uniref:Helix-turn-helix domain-containing protein n=1 Tax=Holdemanella porci TaxID=2652276 RepID=A0A6N7V2B2_9FIRM|nr:helix-turn-helix transcriptional regulator [Holdemanella porci]MSS56423.1 helix-turn-helix domain-containing protein [Holdemanella porci]